jgi:hypothetical protein
VEDTPIGLNVEHMKSRMQDVLKIVRGQRKSSRKSWLNHVLVGQGHIIFLIFLTSDFVDFCSSSSI